MKRSEAIEILSNFWIEDLNGESTQLGTFHPQTAEELLTYLIGNGFPIPCNKKGKFDWDKEVKDESI